MKILTKNWTSLKTYDLVDIECDNCHTLFTNPKHRLQDRISRNKSTKLFCSTRCMGAANTTKIQVLCKQCGISVEKQPSSIKNSNVFCSHSCAAKFSNTHSLSDRKRGPLSNPNSKRFLRSQKPKKIRLTSTNKQCKECGIQFLGLPSRKYCSRTCSHKNAYHPNSSRVYKYNYNGFNLDSGAELYFAKQLDLHQIIWIKNDGIKLKQAFQFVDSKNKLRKYYPDFFLPDYNIWIEIKGRRYIRPDDDRRRSAVPQPVILLLSNEFKTNLNPFFQNLAVPTKHEFAST